MPGSPTPNLGLIVPTVGGDANNWGTELNSDLAVIDTLAVYPVTNISISTILTQSNATEQIIRVTTGSSVITVTLPAASISGKTYTIIKIDSGSGSVSIVPPSGTISGQASWVRATQWSFLRVSANGASYDAIGYN